MHWPHRISRRLDLEFGTPRRSGGPAAWLLLVVAVVFGADVARSYLAQREAHAALSSRIAASPAPEPPRLRAYDPGDLDREISSARVILKKIALPWNTLFKALGASEVEGIALLSVEPDADAGTVQLTGVARDVPAMLTYLARLEASPHLSGAMITRHEIRRTDVRFPVYFVMSAAWGRA